MDNSDWHERFLIQAKWTEQLRPFLYNQVGINDHSRILEVGCGTGVITSELKQYSNLPSIGIDFNFKRVVKADFLFSDPWYSCADAYQLPFASNTMDYVISHFLLLWLKDPTAALSEMIRVVKSGGVVIALAEPDYLARVDNPQDFRMLGILQTQALINQGANPMIGRRLPELFALVGFKEVQYGVSGFQTSPNVAPEWFENEWKTLRDDLGDILSEQELNRLQKLDRECRLNGSRVLWVPTFYAFGTKV